MWSFCACHHKPLWNGCTGEIFILWFGVRSLSLWACISCWTLLFLWSILLILSWTFCAGPGVSPCRVSPQGAEWSTFPKESQIEHVVKSRDGVRSTVLSDTRRHKAYLFSCIDQEEFILNWSHPNNLIAERCYWGQFGFLHPEQCRAQLSTPTLVEAG